MKLINVLSALAASFWLAATTYAQIPAAEQLLPDDTIALVTVPDWTKLSSYYKQSPYSQLWADPAMKPFKDKFMTKLKSDFVEPLERELGTKFESYQDLLQGQVTIAITPPREGSKDPLGLLVLLDAKDKSEALKTRLEELKKKWTESGKQTKSEKIRETDFTVITISDEDWKKFMSKAFPKSKAEEEENKDEEKSEPTQLHIGQYKSLLLMAENPKSIEKIIARQSGGLVPPLGEQAAFQKNFAPKFRDALGFAWLNWKPLYTVLIAEAAKAEQAGAQNQPGMPNMSVDKFLPALGLAGLESIGFQFSGNNDGGFGEFFISVPEAQREGLFKMLALQKKESAPPPFIPAEAVKFQRWRLDVQKAWEALEATISKIDPNIAGMFMGMINQVGKEKDPNFDFEKNFIGNIGDDLISFSKSPRNMKAEELATPPSLFLLGSPNTSELIETIKTLTLLAPPPFIGEPPKEREFLGKKIYTLSPGSLEAPDAEEDGDDADKDAPPIPPTPPLNFAASGGYIAFSTDAAMLEEYLRSGEATGKSLRDTPGLTEAAQKIGGLDAGFFAFENQKETMRYMLETIKNDKEGFERLFFPMQFNLQAEEEGADDEKSKEGVKSWFDYSLLPNYDAVAKYFHIAVYTGTLTPEGLSFRFFGPTPPQMKK